MSLPSGPFKTVVFGLTDQDTAPIVRHMRQSDAFEIVAWFGLVDDATHNSYAFYQFQNDYNPLADVPEELYYRLQRELVHFMDQAIRRHDVSGQTRVIPSRRGDFYADLDQFHRYIYFFWELLTKKNVDLVIIDTLPHCCADWILVQLAQYLGLRLLMTYPLLVPNKFMYFTELTDNSVDFSVYQQDALRPVLEPDTQIPIEKREALFYMNFSSESYAQSDTALFTAEDWQHMWRSWQWDVLHRFQRKRLFKRWSFFARLHNPDLTFNEPYHPTSYPFKKLWYDLRHHFKQLYHAKQFRTLWEKTRLIGKYLDYKDFKRQLHSLIQTDVSLTDQPFVYFPLPFQPETSTQLLGNQIYLNQALVIEKVARLLPADWVIYVKEHPWQSEVCRPPSFYQRLAAVPNVRMVPIDMPTFTLLDHCQFVATTSGTVGWEGIKNGKPVLLFGRSFYQDLPGVVRYTDRVTIQQILQTRVDEAHLQQAWNTLISRCHTGVANAEYGANVPQFDAEANARHMVQVFAQLARQIQPATPQPSACQRPGP